VTIGRLTNISTRLRVGVDANVAIGGFILRGAEAKRVILRASGPALASALPGTLSDPVLELYDSAGRPVASNDNWQSSAQAGEIAGSGFAPGNPLEAAIVATLPSGSYTAIVRGANGAQGIGLVEGYELDGNSTRLVNLSTRGRVGGGNEVMIGGVIVAGAEKRVMVRAVAPSLASVIPDTLADPMLELYNAAGQLVIANDNWNTSPQVNDILATAYRPGSNAESAVIANLPPGNYTAIVRGANGGQGVALVEVYDLEP
jgi:hypothetical protein